jgi:hypothetical protein
VAAPDQRAGDRQAGVDVPRNGHRAEQNWHYAALETMRSSQSSG